MWSWKFDAVNESDEQRADLSQVCEDDQIRTVYHRRNVLVESSRSAKNTADNSQFDATKPWRRRGTSFAFSVGREEFRSERQVINDPLTNSVVARRRRNYRR